MSQAKIIHRSDESVFEALVPDEDGGAGHVRTTFPASTVAQVTARGEKAAALRLFTGAVILVGLPYETLKDYLYGDNMKPRQSVYDLTAVTGPALLPPAPSPSASSFSPEEMVEGQGIFVGQYVPKDRDGVSLSKVFNVFAAPQNLPGDSIKHSIYQGRMIYTAAVQQLAGLKDWHGHDGTNYAVDRDFYAALEDGSYNGGWVIPPLDILYGRNVDDTEAAPDGLIAHMGKGAFNGTAPGRQHGMLLNDKPEWYWSSTEGKKDPLIRSCVDLGGSVSWDYIDHRANDRLSCRPVRLVACAPKL